MTRERAAGGSRRAHRSRRRAIWVGGIVALVVGLVLWDALGGGGGPPTGRPFGAGLPPEQAARLGGSDANGAAAARRAEIAAEEARLAALRAARERLQQDVAALQAELEERQRTVASQRAGTNNAAAAAVTGGGTPAAPAQEPPGRSVRVFVHHRANSPAAANAASEIAQTLRGGGFEVQAVRGAPFVPSTPVVRYFHEEDQAAAARLAARLGRGWAIQDFRAFLPQPAPQTLEVWLPSS